VRKRASSPGVLRCLIQEPYRQPGHDLFRRDTCSRTGGGAGANSIGRRDRAGIRCLVGQPSNRDGRISAGARVSRRTIGTRCRVTRDR
jgi:hypothetical protein